MIDLNLDQEFSLATKLAKKALIITEWFRNNTFTSFQKKDESPVTIADFASQIYLISELRKNFPEDHIIAEEENSLLDKNARIAIKKCFQDLGIGIKGNFGEILNYRGVKAKRSWVIDPIDGTIGFQKNLYYAVGIGLLMESDPVLSVIATPKYRNTGLAIFGAMKGKGAKASYKGSGFKKISVSNTKNLKHVTLCHSLHYDEPWVSEFATKMKFQKLIQIDSMIKFCMIADGSADLYLKPMDPSRSFTWDFCQGDLLVREAGGIVRDTNNKDLIYQDRNCLFTGLGLIAANPSVYQKTRDLIQKMFRK